MRVPKKNWSLPEQNEMLVYEIIVLTEQMEFFQKLCAVPHKYKIIVHYREQQVCGAGAPANLRRKEARK
jgi:hypothetical protein